MAFCSSCGNQLGDGERFCSKCGADQVAKAGGAPATTPAATPPSTRAQYPPGAGMVPLAAMPPAAGMQGQNKVWYAVIGAAVLFVLYHFLGPPQQQQQGGAQINLIFVVSEDLAYQS